MILKPDSVQTIPFGDDVLIINKRIIPDDAVATKYVADYVKKGSPMKPCKRFTMGKPHGIVIHNTSDIVTSAETTPAEQYSRATYPNCNMGGVMVHFYADKSCAWQNLDLREQGWHASDGSSTRRAHSGAYSVFVGGNVDCIAIEIIGTDGEETGAKLAAYIMYMFNLKINDIYTHNYFMYGKDEIVPGAKKNCPIYILGHWQKFLDKVQCYYNKLCKAMYDEVSAAVTPDSPDAELGFEFVVMCGSFTVKENAKKFAEKVRKELNVRVRIMPVKVLDVRYYRVMLSNFNTYREAEAYMKYIKSKGYEGAVIVL